ncbi:serine/threonine protein kinase [Pontibacter sp. JAM-7]|uniref:serine/threonine protein kinase n=1 Tax=Pontibacter sp. JAM-7 TaxID=3366581 RepID=UPI003AF9FC0E
MSGNPHPFEILTPSFLLDAIEAKGFWCDGRFLALNSYENRVYQVGIEESAPLIAKFYRPERWSDAQIQEEHDFCFQLQEHELSVVAPIRDEQGNSLFHYQGLSFALFPRRGGHAPELSNPDHLLQMGRMLGRIHSIGASRPYEHRPVLDSQSFGHASVALVSEQFIPAELKPAYDSLARDLLQKIDARLAEFGSQELIRVHGDCHTGNILWRDDQVNFVDLDDSRMAPAIQDIWMLLSGSREEQTLQLSEIVDGYNEFYDFRPRELHLIEALRSLRMLHYAAWLARRWHDPAFPMAFPWFNSVRYWSEHILELREQLAALDEPVLRLM